MDVGHGPSDAGYGVTEAYESCRDSPYICRGSVPVLDQLPDFLKEERQLCIKLAKNMFRFFRHSSKTYQDRDQDDQQS
jgi:hypothetical protein